jgi:hypothetical protein
VKSLYHTHLSAVLTELFISLEPSSSSMNVQRLPASQDSNDGRMAPQDVTYMEGFDDSSANVVLMGSDKVALRVHDYFLKAAR